MEVQLKEQIYRYIDNPLDAGTNFDTGLYYEALGQNSCSTFIFP